MSDQDQTQHADQQTADQDNTRDQHIRFLEDSLRSTEYLLAQARAEQMQPTDRDVFFEMLPIAVGAYVAKHDTPQTIVQLSVALARESAAQLAGMGLCRRTSMTAPQQNSLLPDTAQPASPVSIAPPLSQAAQPLAAQAPHPQLGNNNGHGLQGAMVSHYPTQNHVKIPSL